MNGLNNALKSWALIAAFLSVLSLVSFPAHAAKPGGPQLGSPGGGPVIDKSGDSQLQAMIKEVAPKFRQLRYEDEKSGIALNYNLFIPENIRMGEKYPLVLFMADASTPGTEIMTPLRQGYGALVWATEEAQKRNPCFVLVPQFSGVAVNDAYEKTPEVDAVLGLVEALAQKHPVDRQRLYTTGQSMGGMISMYYNIIRPGMFAASIFVDCHWDMGKADMLAENTFTYITAGDSGKSAKNIPAIEEAAKRDGRKFAFASWSAKLPQAEQDELARKLLSGGAPINIINFTSGSVLPASGKGSEHMYSFDYAYKLEPVRQWLFRQTAK